MSATKKGRFQGFNPKALHDLDGDTPRDTMRRIFGNRLTMTEGTRDLDMVAGPAHTTTGLPLAVHGEATVVQQRVAAALGNYQDPIKLLLPTTSTTGVEYVVTRKYVKGGQSIITPERAPARTVAIQEDQRTVRLERYGGDLEMNLNLFLRPDDAKEEFEMKLDAQTRMLNKTMVELGYQALLEQGMHLGDAIMANGEINKEKFDTMRQAEATAVFGAMQKSRYPLQNLMAAAKMAGTYNAAVNGGYDSMILPAGMLEMERVTKRENMEYNLTGTPDGKRKQIKVALENVYQDPRVPGMRLMVHHQFPSYENGSAYPKATGSALATQTPIGIFYAHNNQTSKDKFRHADHKLGQYSTVDQSGTAGQVVFSSVMVEAASAIMAVSGADTGELLYAYPSTGISTSQTTEAMKMQLRVYMGAIVYDPTRVLVLPDIHITGIDPKHTHTSTAQAVAADRPQFVDLLEAEVTQKTGGAFPAAAIAHLTSQLGGDIGKVQTQIKDLPNPAKETLLQLCRVYGKDADTFKGLLDAGQSANLVLDPEKLAEHHVPHRFYQGRVEVAAAGATAYTLHQKNMGHLGPLDTPGNPRLRGQYLFDEAP